MFLCSLRTLHLNHFKRALKHSAHVQLKCVLFNPPGGNHSASFTIPKGRSFFVSLSLFSMGQSKNPNPPPPKKNKAAAKILCDAVLMTACTVCCDLSNPQQITESVHGFHFPQSSVHVLFIFLYMFFVLKISGQGKATVSSSSQM